MGKAHSAFAVTEASLRREISDMETRKIILIRQQTTKLLISLRGLSASLLSHSQLTAFLIIQLIYCQSYTRVIQ